MTALVDSELPLKIDAWPNKLPILPVTLFKPPKALLTLLLAALVRLANFPPVEELTEFNHSLYLINHHQKHQMLFQYLHLMFEKLMKNLLLQE